MQIRRRLIGAVAAAAAVLTLGLTAPGAATASTPVAQAHASAKAPAQSVGKQAVPAVKAGSKDHASVATAPLGATKLVALKANGAPAVTPSAITPKVGNNGSVDLTSPYQYCQGGELYTPAYNYSSATQYVEYVLSNGSQTRTFYTSVAAGSYAWPTWMGVSGSWYVYQYVWNGSSYAYDEYKSGTLTCSVSVTLNTNSGYTGYVLVTATNHGTAYADVDLNEVAPYGYSGTYTGTHWVYPAAGGGSVSTYLYVGTGQHWGIVATVLGSLYGQWSWYA